LAEFRPVVPMYGQFLATKWRGLLFLPQGPDSERKRMRRLTAVLILCLATLAFAQTTGSAGKKNSSSQPAEKKTEAKPGLPTEATVDSFFKHMFGYDPNISWKVLKIEEAHAAPLAEAIVAMKNPQGQGTVRLFITPDGKHAIIGDDMPFGADPFAANRELLAKEVNGPSKGPDNAPVTIVEFSDLECPSCKAAQPTIDTLLENSPNAKFIFQNFPLEQLHPWAFKAATYADCIGRSNKDAFWKFVADTYANQQDINPENADDKLKGLATGGGADGAAIAACAALPATAERVRHSMDLGLKLDVTGTPTLFVNGRLVGNVNAIPPEALKAIVDFAASPEGK
jgi:protein-disulfide isomerase